MHELHTRHPRLSHGTTVTFICAQIWGVFAKDPSHVAEQFILAKCLQESKGFLWAPKADLMDESLSSHLLPSQTCVNFMVFYALHHRC